MATKETAKTKFINSVTSDLAPEKMASKLSSLPRHERQRKRRPHQELGQCRCQECRGAVRQVLREHEGCLQVAANPPAAKEPLRAVSGVALAAAGKPGSEARGERSNPSHKQ